MSSPKGPWVFQQMWWYHQQCPVDPYWHSRPGHCWDETEGFEVQLVTTGGSHQIKQLVRFFQGFSTFGWQGLSWPLLADGEMRWWCPFASVATLFVNKNTPSHGGVQPRSGARVQGVQRAQLAQRGVLLLERWRRHPRSVDFVRGPLWESKLAMESGHFLWRISESKDLKGTETQGFPARNRVGKRGT